MDNYDYEDRTDYYYGNWNDFTLDDEKRARSRFSRIFLSLFLFTVISNAVALVAELIIMIAFGVEYATEIASSYWYVWTMNILAMYVIAFPIYFLMVRNMRKVERIKSTIAPMELLKLFFIAQAFAYAGNLISSIFSAAVTMVLGEVPEDPLSEMIYSSPLWIIILVTVILAPIVEELMFRKLIIDRMSIYGDKLAIIVSSIAFGLFHGNFYQIFYATLIGFILGYVYVKTANIIYSIILHVAFNFWGSVLPWIFEDEILGMADMYEQIMIAMAEGGQMPALELAAGEYVSLILALVYLSVNVMFTVLGVVLFIKRFRKTFISDRCEVLIPARRRAAVIIGNAGAILFLVITSITMFLNIITPFLTSIPE